MATGLEYISGLIVQSSIRENLYRCRYESGNNNCDPDGFLSSHVGYREALKELYTRILKFQATSVCYYSKNTPFRIGLDMAKWNNWDSLLADIKTAEKGFSAINDLWKDTRYEEECTALGKRHQESIKNLISIASDVSGLRKAIEDAQQDSQRKELLSWLSSIDPSEIIILRVINTKLGQETGLLTATMTSNTGNWSQILFSGCMGKVLPCLLVSYHTDKYTQLALGNQS